MGQWSLSTIYNHLIPPFNHTEIQGILQKPNQGNVRIILFHIFRWSKKMVYIEMAWNGHIHGQNKMVFPTAIYRLQSYLLDEDIGVTCCSFRERNLRNNDIVLQVLGGAVGGLNGFNGYNWLQYVRIRNSKRWDMGPLYIHVVHWNWSRMIRMIEPHPSITKIDQQVLTRIGKDSTQNMAPDLARHLDCTRLPFHPKMYLPSSETEGWNPLPRPRENQNWKKTATSSLELLDLYRIHSFCSLIYIGKFNMLAGDDTHLHPVCVFTRFFVGE